MPLKTPSLGTPSIAESSINAVLRMAEQWVTQHLIMIAMEKIFGATSTATSATDIGLKEAGRQAAIGDAAATAAIEAAWLGPEAAIAAAAAVEAALQGITSFAEGGIVRANLHEGEMVLPTHLSTFVQTAAAAASAGGLGAPGGTGGPGGPGGPGAAGTSKQMTNHIHIETHGGGSNDPNAIAAVVVRQLRRRAISW